MGVCGRGVNVAHASQSHAPQPHFQYGHCLELEVLVAIVRHMLEHFLQAVLKLFLSLIVLHVSRNFELLVNITGCRKGQ